MGLPQWRVARTKFGAEQTHLPHNSGQTIVKENIMCIYIYTHNILQYYVTTSISVKCGTTTEYDHFCLHAFSILADRGQLLFQLMLHLTRRANQTVYPVLETKLNRLWACVSYTFHIHFRASQSDSSWFFSIHALWFTMMLYISMPTHLGWFITHK